jgi:DNA polymerase-3 subunit gamma/tau
MSYQVLARKWRPRNFATLVGQEHVVRALTHALSEQRLHHAYLFTGTRGVGKTTLARILAKSLNCETGITATPCGACSACQEIDAGRFVDLLEVDAATNTKVDEMRQLLENAVYAPTRGRFKVYVIDEVHMLSNSAFNAMLKTLEEPPEHVKFILATTDPQKIPVTVLSRCLQFNLKQMPTAAICGHLGHILEAEGVSYDAPALNLIARSAAGSMRDALSLLDQAIAHGAGKVEEGQVREMLGTVDQGYLFALLEALTENDAARLVAIADDMSIRSLSFSGALQDLAALVTRIQIAQCAPQAVADDEPEAARLRQLARSLTPEFVQLAYQIVIHGRDEMPMAPDEYAGFVMTLLRLHAFRPEAAPEPRERPPVPAGRPSAENSGRPVAAPAPPAPPVREAPREAPQSPVASGDIDWHMLVGQLQLGGMARELVQHCELRGLSGDAIVLRLAPVHRHLQMKPAQDKVQQALSEHFGRPVVLKIELANVESDTPAAAAQRGRQERQERAIAAIEQDPFVRDVIETFDASLLETSIKPIA